VTSGQLLAELETQRLEDAVKQAEALALQQARFSRSLRPAAGSRKSARRRPTPTKPELMQTTAQLLWGRTRELLHDHAVSQQKADDDQAAAQAAKATQEAAQQALNLAVAGPRIEDIEAERAALRAAQANLSLRRQELKDARLYAPADGIIRDRILEPGTMVTPQNPVLILALTNPLWVRHTCPSQTWANFASA